MNLEKDTILYAINVDKVEVLELVIDDVKEEKAFGEVISYSVYFHFFNEQRQYYFRIDTRSKENKDIELCRIFTFKHFDFNIDNPYYLIGDDIKKLVEHYISKLEESCEYQRKVINEGIKTIEHLQDKIVSYKTLL